MSLRTPCDFDFKFQGLGRVTQSPENIQFFLGTTITFQKLPTFLAVNFSYYGLFQAERVVHIVPEIAFLAFLYQIFGKIIQNIAFHKINIISSYFS